ncbi:hypothetical protein [Actinokineospora cianjurensis]|uniref:Uncharacterized protein n=1 Tax=Actinokineospora cianjurensis TaxID=585224 RepID=A0A421B6C3_9PSEU|nr:hypothetical protein [Actinokineospora cianjurensis]RLK59770.1 hypothetical protein CLV68_0254 [Actinokineospora cianjurensis]
MAAFDDMVRRAAAGQPGALAVLRAELMTQPRAWLVDQLLATVAPSSGYRPRPVELDERRLVEHTARFGSWDTTACLVGPPPPAGRLVDRECRTVHGEELLDEAKDLLHALLAGDSGLTPIRRARLTLTVPDAKVAVFGFLRGTITRTPVGGGETALLVEYPEVAADLVGDAVVAALRVVNGLELNEAVLYTRKAG